MCLQRELQIYRHLNSFPDAPVPTAYGLFRYDQDKDTLIVGLLLSIASGTPGCAPAPEEWAEAR